MTVVSTILSRAASRAKGFDFEIDPSIPPTVLFRIAARRGTMKVRGRARFPRSDTPPFVGSGVHLGERRRITLGRGVTFGDRCVIDALSRHGVRLGDHVTVGRDTRIECTGSIRSLGSGIEVGESVGLGTNCYYGCAGGVTIGAHTIVGNFVSFHSESHVSTDRTTPIHQQGVTHRGIVVGEDCWIGAKATILDGATLGRGCVVAAGAVVTAGNYEAFAVYGGVPARLIGRR